MTDGPDAGGGLRRLLLVAGVGSKWSNRELERIGGYESDGEPRMGYQTWRRVMQPIPPGGSGYNLSPAQLRIMVEVLSKAGARVDGRPLTVGQVTRCWAADFGHAGYESVTVGDSIADMIERLPFMAPEDLATIEAAASAARAAMERQERSDDDGEGLHRRSE